MKTLETASYKLSELSEEARKKAHLDWRKNLEVLNKESLDKFCELFKINVKNWEYTDRHHIDFSLDVDDEIKELCGRELADYLRANYDKFVHSEMCDRPFTGYYMDNVLFDEIWQFMESPNEVFDFYDLIKECLGDWIIACDEDCSNKHDFEVFKEISIASNWRYAKDGTLIKNGNSQECGVNDSNAKNGGC